ncbi:rluC [Symbiodinium natans]|uniref:RluC protein n=1 Tax=Symbiodinium natans TaxID=878477 RepID=A0A812JCK7_9DINO|nr:rluC [Symbiodinium natans]
MGRSCLELQYGVLWNIVELVLVLLQTLSNQPLLLAAAKPRNVRFFAKEHAFDFEETVEDWFQKRFQKKIQTCHSLEEEVSGVVLMGSKSKTLQLVKLQFQEHKVKRVFHALVLGHPSWDDAKFNTPVKGGRPWTLAKTLRRGFWAAIAGAATPQPIALVEAWTMVGRTHQIQEHLRAAGHPVLGDIRHADMPETPFGDAELHCFRVFLHLSRLELCLREEEPTFVEVPHGFDCHIVDLPEVRRLPATAPLESLQCLGTEVLDKATGSDAVARLRQWSFLVSTDRISRCDCLWLLDRFPESLTNFTPHEVWAGEGFVVLHKPFNRLLYHKKRLPKDLPLMDWVRGAYPHESPRLCHRLDYGTSGVLLIALNRDTARQSLDWFSKRQVKKVYHAIVFGLPTWHDEHTLSAPLHGKTAETTVKVIQHGSWLASERPFAASLVEASPQTGRTHQIRLHLAMAGHPIIGDTDYSPSFAHRLYFRLCLHATSISLPLPLGESSVTVHAKHPFDALLGHFHEDVESLVIPSLFSDARSDSHDSFQDGPE